MIQTLVHLMMLFVLCKSISGLLMLLGLEHARMHRIPFDSDHVVLEAHARCPLYQMIPEYRDNKWIKFNSDFRCLIADNPKCLQSFAVSILRAAETNLDEVPREQKGNI